jgi:hypothetical protein
MTLRTKIYMCDIVPESAKTLSQILENHVQSLSLRPKISTFQGVGKVLHHGCRNIYSTQISIHL